MLSDNNSNQLHLLLYHALQFVTVLPYTKKESDKFPFPVHVPGIPYCPQFPPLSGGNSAANATSNQNYWMEEHKAIVVSNGDAVAE